LKEVEEKEVMAKCAKILSMYDLFYRKIKKGCRNIQKTTLENIHR
jgi:hypothetical protein